MKEFNHSSRHTSRRVFGKISGFCLAGVFVAFSASQLNATEMGWNPRPGDESSLSNRIPVSASHNNLASVHAGMALIPGGTFEMGIDEEDLEELVAMGHSIPHMRMDIARTWWSNEIPRHSVKIDSFYMDTHEVTNAQFREFTQATGYKAQGNWQKFSTEDRADHPVVNVSWNDARAYAEWAGKRLPTEAEWEYVAKGGKHVKWFPWGDTPDATKANYQSEGETIIRDLRERILGKKMNTKAVGSYEPNGYGLYDVVGNVEEWCEDAYRPYPGGLPWNHEVYQKPWGSRTKWSESQKVVRGGHWGSLNHAYVRITMRGSLDPDSYRDSLGFRCAKSMGVNGSKRSKRE